MTWRLVPASFETKKQTLCSIFILLYCDRSLTSLKLDVPRDLLRLISDFYEPRWSTDCTHGTHFKIQKSQQSIVECVKAYTHPSYGFIHLAHTEMTFESGQRYEVLLRVSDGQGTSVVPNKFIETKPAARKKSSDADLTLSGFYDSWSAPAIPEKNSVELCVGVARQQDMRKCYNSFRKQPSPKDLYATRAHRSLACSLPLRSWIKAESGSIIKLSLDFILEENTRCAYQADSEKGSTEWVTQHLNWLSFKQFDQEPTKRKLFVSAITPGITVQIVDISEVDSRTQETPCKERCMHALSYDTQQVPSQNETCHANRAKLHVLRRAWWINALKAMSDISRSRLSLSSRT